MNRNVIRWIIAALMLLSLTLGLTFPSAVEAEGAVLPLDFKEGGYPAKPGAWVFADDGETPVSYEDSTIQVSVTKGEITLSVKGKKVKHETFVVRVKIQDVSQLRTAASNDSYTGGAAEAEDVATDKRAIVAMNGDYFKGGNRDAGYLVRQGELIRDLTGNKRKVIFDMLIIDSEGDFHAVPSAVTENIEAYVAENLTPQNRTILDTFNLGPVLVADGQVQDISASEAARQGEYQWKYPQQRIALVQTGHLEYAIVEVFGRTDSSAGMDLQQFAEFVAEQCPDAVMAYNLDGGGSTNLIITKYNDSYVEGSKKKKERDIVTSRRICKTPGHREIHDLIYFASAEPLNANGSAGD